MSLKTSSPALKEKQGVMAHPNAGVRGHTEVHDSRAHKKSWPLPKRRVSGSVVSHASMLGYRYYWLFWLVYVYFFLNLIFTYLIYWCVCVCISDTGHGGLTAVRGRLLMIGSENFYHMSQEDQTPSSGLQEKCIFPPSHLTSHVLYGTADRISPGALEHACQVICATRTAHFR